MKHQTFSAILIATVLGLSAGAAMAAPDAMKPAAGKPAAATKTTTNTTSMTTTTTDHKQNAAMGKPMSSHVVKEVTKTTHSVVTKPAMHTVAAKPATKRAWHATRTWTGSGVMVDGVFGAQTEAAVMAFQRRHGIMADGVAGPQTAKAAGVPYKWTLRRGAKGASVSMLQGMLGGKHSMMAHHSAMAAHHSKMAAQHSSMAAHHSAMAAHHSAMAAQHAAKADAMSGTPATKASKMPMAKPSTK